MIRTFACLTCAAVAGLLTGCSTADLVIVNGAVVTLEDDIGQVEAIAIDDGLIRATGSNRQIRRMVGPNTRVIDAGGNLVIPGFIDGHGHFTSLGETKLNLDLMNVSSWQQVAEMVRQAVDEAQPGEWIIGRGWHQEKFDRSPGRVVEGFPTHEAISAISPNNPVCLRHASGHACFFNARAMELAGINDDTPDPPGGEIIRDEQGRAIGIFSETAAGLVDRVRSAQQQRTPAEREALTRRLVKLAEAECISKGVTSFQDAGSSFSTIDVIRRMAAENAYDIRLYVMIRESPERLARHMADYRMIGDRLTVRAVKRSIDGALGSRGAWLLEPYSDMPDSAGLNTDPVEDVRESARLCKKHDFQFCVHAIGDRANRETLDIFEAHYKSDPPMKDPRWRVEHVQHLHPTDIPRFAELGVIASMQAIHCTSDAPYVLARLGAQRASEGAYVWRKLVDSGAIVSNGTDTPVEDVDPIACFHATVTRQVGDGSRFYPDQSLTRLEALRTYTINAAYSAFEEDRKGTLRPGKLGDVVILSQNILTCSADAIRDARVLYTVIGGKVVYESPRS